MRLAGGLFVWHLESCAECFVAIELVYLVESASVRVMASAKTCLEASVVWQPYELFVTICARDPRQLPGECSDQDA